MKKHLALAFLLLIAICTHAQIVDPVHTSVQLKTNNSAEGEIVFNLKIDAGWHVYSTNLGTNGPIEATLHVNKLEGVERVGKLVARGREISKMDNLFGMKLRYFEHSVQFVQKVKFTKPQYKLDVYLEYGACNDENCMPPQEAAFKKSGKSPAVDEKESQDKNKEEDVDKTSTNVDSLQVASDSIAGQTVTTETIAQNTDLWQPVIKDLQEQDGRTESNNSMWYLFFMGFVGGLLALFTPCVWPIIPMTVSFFLKRT